MPIKGFLSLGTFTVLLVLTVAVLKANGVA
jgi:hypothetical protein